MAQNLQICTACRTEKKPKWKCFTCNSILCDDCNTNIHFNIRKNNSHKVLDLKNVNLEYMKTAMKSITPKDIPCSSHETQSSIIYCHQCERLVCAVCLMEEHQGHKLKLLEQVYTDHFDKMCTTEKNINQSLQKVQPLPEHIEKLKSEELKEYNEAREKILKKDKELKELVTKETDRLVDELEELWNPREKELTKFHKDMVAMKRSLQVKKTQIEEIFLSHDAEKVLEFSNHQDEDTLIYSKNAIKKQSILFSVSTQDFKHVIKFGSIVKVPEFTVEGSFSSDLNDIHRIKTLKNNVNILCPSYQPEFHSFTLKDGRCVIGTTVKVKDVGDRIRDMTVMDNTVLFTLEGSSDIKYVADFPENTTVETFLSLPAALFPTAIHATSTNLFIVFSERDPIKCEKRRGVLIYNHTPSQIGTIEFDPGNQRIFSLPAAITTNINGDICVVDLLRLVVLGELETLKWVYKHPSNNDKNAFTPRDVLTTQSGLILVTDYYYDAVHVLSMDGHPITILNQIDGLKRPWGLNIDHNGKLQIGCDRENRNKKSQLFVFNINI